MTYLTKEEVIQWFLAKESMSSKKLQKLLYYSYVWGLVFFNDDENKIINKLFDANFEAWVHGFVIPEIQETYKHYNFGPIPKADEQPNFSERINDLLTQVYDAYGHYTGDELTLLMEAELPWKEARGDASPLEPRNDRLNDRIAYEFYQNI